MKPDFRTRAVLGAGGLLAISALLATGILWLTNWHAKPYIVENERIALLRSLNAVISRDRYDNDPVTDSIGVDASAITANQITSRIYRARKSGQNAGVAITAVAPDGYSGSIVLLVGIDYPGTLTGVRILSHHETPGLGDAIEEDRSDWITKFTGRSRHNPEDARWKVKKDGGDFMQFTGATITPRAVVKAIHACLVFYDQHRGELYDLKAGNSYKIR